jgi:uncharacterized protein (TIGR03437 family)
MQLDSAGKVATTLGNVRLFFDGTQAPILSVTSGQVGAVAPFDLDGKSDVQVRLEYQGVASQTVPATVASTSPGIFTQDGAPSGLALVYNSDYTLNSQENPAAEDSAVTVYWTGAGQTDPNGVDGRIESGPLSRPKAEVKVTIGGQSAAVGYSGGVPYGWSGLLMADVKVPVGLVTSDPPVPLLAPMVLTAGGASSPDGTRHGVREIERINEASGRRLESGPGIGIHAARASLLPEDHRCPARAQSPGRDCRARAECRRSSRGAARPRFASGSGVKL